jgi:hypothetical protein
MHRCNWKRMVHHKLVAAIVERIGRLRLACASG